jgi:hypothetical protein
MSTLVEARPPKQNKKENLIKKLLPILNDSRNIKPANNFVDKKKLNQLNNIWNTKVSIFVHSHFIFRSVQQMEINKWTTLKAFTT